MPKMKVVLLNEARMELRDIAAYHKLKVGIDSARRITDRILGALDHLIDFPEMGNIPPAKMIADDYLCFYQVKNKFLFTTLFVEVPTILNAFSNLVFIL